MKFFHYILMMLLLSLLFSCEKEPSLEAARNPISFSPSVSVETKALSPVDSTNLICNNNQVHIFGVRTYDTNQKENVFPANQDLVCSISGPNTTWNYSPLVNWKETGTYYFAGVYPYNSNGGASLNTTTYQISVPYAAGDNKDVMLARQSRTMGTPNATRPVNLVFNHACSAVRFLFGTAQGSDVYYLTDFRVEGVYGNGTLSAPLITSDPNDPNPGVFPANWSRSGSRTNLFSWEANIAQSRNPVRVAHPSNQNDPDGYTNSAVFGQWFYMVPQQMDASSAIRFSISHNADGSNPFTTLMSITDRDGIPGADSWIPNRVYNYYIILNQKLVTIYVKTTDWDVVQVTTDDLTFSD